MPPRLNPLPLFSVPTLCSFQCPRAHCGRRGPSGSRTNSQILFVPVRKNHSSRRRLDCAPTERSLLSATLAGERPTAQALSAIPPLQSGLTVHSRIISQGG